ncbi:MAG: hypothetical protein KDI16_15800 [Halioglobus sp.]|nr:hypothetical protein [Halioglobus sp.]
MLSLMVFSHIINFDNGKRQIFCKLCSVWRVARADSSGWRQQADLLRMGASVHHVILTLFC